MLDQRLVGARVLVAEDDPILAFDIIGLLRKAGAEIVGPARTLAHTLDLIASPSLSCALLDINLRDGLVFPAALNLSEQCIKIIFHTGCADLETLRREWPSAAVLPKPAASKCLIEAVRLACFGNDQLT
jgi:DNA-binding NarL/FixJ family response regulator